LFIDNNRIITAEEDQFKVWDRESNTLLHVIDRNDHLNWIASKFSIKVMYKVWEQKIPLEPPPEKGGARILDDFYLLPGDNYYITLAEDGTIAVREARSGNIVMSMARKAGWQGGHIEFNYEMTKGLTVNNDRIVNLWDLQTGDCLNTFTYHTKTTVSASFVGEDRLIKILRHHDNIIEVVDAETGELRWSKNVDVLSRGMTKDGRHMLLSTNELVDIETGKTLATISDVQISGSFSDDSRYLLNHEMGVPYKLEIDWEYDFPSCTDWDDRARPFLSLFLKKHTSLPGKGWGTKPASPEWSEEDFQNLLIELQRFGYGWLRPEGVRRKLEEMARERS
jgi:WD40 repeat protein